MKSDIQPGHVDFNLDVKYVEGRIYNPKTNRYDWVKLRSYVHKDKWHNYNEFVGPTIEVQPGKTVRVNLANKLPEKFDPQKCQDKQGKPEENELNCNNYNITNLHSHGLWISPAGNSDNVLSVVKPGVTFQYEYNIPSDHPAGTFWYHPHLHGSSALQVGSGMSGALIVRGDRVPIQIVAIYDPNGKDVSGPNTTDNYNGTTDPDLEYRGLKGVWKDTIWVKPPSGNKRYTVVIRTRYDRYIGDFVLHCHILDHEDEGMMQNVSIVIPGTAPLGTDGNN
ncbi:MAG: multicopper oxidase domain-containing protein [Dolichospermum sp.]